MHTAVLLNLWHLKGKRMLIWPIKQKNGFITGHARPLASFHLCFKLTTFDNSVCKDRNREALWIRDEITVKQRYFLPFNKQVVMFIFCTKKIYRERGEECVSVNAAVCNDFWITLEGERSQHKNHPSSVIDFCAFLWTHRIGFRAGVFTTCQWTRLSMTLVHELQAINRHFYPQCLILAAKTRPR